jgi:hypothetical protein
MCIYAGNIKVLFLPTGLEKIKLTPQIPDIVIIMVGRGGTVGSQNFFADPHVKSL